MSAKTQTVGQFSGCRKGRGFILTERQRDRETETETERQRDRETERQRDRDRK